MIESKTITDVREQIHWLRKNIICKQTADSMERLLNENETLSAENKSLREKLRNALNNYGLPKDADSTQQNQPQDMAEVLGERDVRGDLVATRQNHEYCFDSCEASGCKLPCQHEGKWSSPK